jgi:hypothetical protein
MSEAEPDYAESGTYELLSRARRGLLITVRDDRCDLAELMDAALVDRRRGGRFRVVDSGRFPSQELEWLVRAGADLYTSDEVERSPAELDLLVRAAARGRAVVACFQHGALTVGTVEIARTGAYLHVSRREQERDTAVLADLAYACRRSGAWLVDYEHGALAAGLVELARDGGWIHLSEGSLPARESLSSFLDMAREAAAAGAGVVLHLEETLEPATALDIMNAGAHVIFRRPTDFRSPLRELERRAARRPLDFRAYYLTPDFLP